MARTVWEEKYMAIVEDYAKTSRTRFGRALTRHAENLLAALYAAGYTAVSQPKVSNHRKANKARYGEWGMSHKQAAAHDKKVVEAVLQKHAQTPFPSRHAMQVEIAGQLADNQTPVESVPTRVRNLGLSLPNPVAAAELTRIPPSVQKWIDFAVIWNDAGYAVDHDLENHFGVKWSTILRRERAYRAYRDEHPEYDAMLPLLSGRKRLTGELIPLPSEVIAQLDVYRFDRTKLDRKKGVVVTAAQWGAPLNRSFWAALKNYCEYHDYELIVMPIKYGRIETRDHKLISVFPPEFEGHVIFDDLFLFGGSLQLNVARFRPTLNKHLTRAVLGMGGKVSQIFAAPKQELEHVGLVSEEYPKAVMTTGAVTHPSYKVDPLGQQDRTGELAAAQHEYAAVVIEPGVRKSHFHFRQLQATKTGEFYDIDVKKGGARLFTENGYEHRPDAVAAVALADWHFRTTSSSVVSATFDKDGILPILNPDDVTLDDMMDNTWATPYFDKDPMRAEILAEHGLDSVEAELEENMREIRWMHSKHPARYHWKPSNHPDVWMRNWVLSEVWRKDPRNRRLGRWLQEQIRQDMELQIADGVAPNKVRTRSPVLFWMREHLQEDWFHILDWPDKLLLPKASKKQTLMSVHGDIAPTGGKGTTEAFRAYLEEIIIGHLHVARKSGKVWQLGTATDLMKHYVHSQTTSWTNTHGVVFENNQKMLINIIRGDWHGQRVGERFRR